MRLIKTFKDPDLGQQFSAFLNSKDIQHQLEAVTNSDWGHEDYGTITYNLWIIDEDQYVEALSYLEKFLDNKESKDFDVSNLPRSSNTTIKFNPDNIPPLPPNPQLNEEDKSPITLYILILCTFLFVLSYLTTPTMTTAPSSVTAYSLFTPEINKSLLYDYPEPFVIVDRIIDQYGVEKVQNPKKLPLQAQSELQKASKMPFWTGIYNDILYKIQHSNTELKIFSAPMFEKISQGQLWRLFTPCLLHSNFLHIFFNMIWLLVLGKQMEKQLSKWRYVAFIVITAVISNTAQYLMSGSNFIGFSGVVCAMIAFIWIRQKKAPWEGYQLQQSTVVFIAIFILGIFAIQFFSFILEVYHQKSLQINIANTAHITGALVGYLLGRFRNPISTTK